MAIKISGSTIIDDSRQIINAGNAGIGTTNPSAEVTVANSGVLAAGIGTFYKVYGDGSELTNIGLGGTNTWTQDSEGNLVAGSGAGFSRDGDTCNNIFIGCKAGAAVNAGDRNILLGYCAGTTNYTSGNSNIAIGDFAGQCANGDYQIILGTSAGFCMSGNGGIAIGYNAGRHKTSGLANVFIGCYAGSCAGTDGCATIVGALAGKCAEGGCSAIFGSKAGFNNTSGDFNTFLGYQAACSSTSGSNLVVVGNTVQPPSLTGDTQLAIGAGATSWLTGNDTFKVGIGTTTYTSSLNVFKDIGGYQVLSAEGEGSTTLEVKTISKTAKHRYPSGGGSSTSGYAIDGAEAPYLTLTPGRTYRFEQSDSSNDNHPLIFYLEADKTTEYTVGVSYYADGAQSTSSAFNTNYNAASVRYTEIVVSDETPVVLHYQCFNHGYMGNAASFPNNVLNTNYQSTIRADLHVTGIATFGSASLKLDGTSNIINVGAALTLGHSQGIQYHTQNLHATGFEVNQINASGITTFTDVKVGSGVTIESNGNANFIGVVTAKNGVSIGGGATIGASSGIVTYYGDGSGLTNVPGGFSPDDDGNLLAGTCAGDDLDGSSGCYNVLIGQCAGQDVTSGVANIIMGCNAGKCVQGGSYNLFLGSFAGCMNFSSSYAVALGHEALRQQSGGTANIGIGCKAGHLVTSGQCNIFLGACAAGGASLTGCDNIIMGREAAKLLTSGSCNVVIGAFTTPYSNTGHTQLAIGAGGTTWIAGDDNFNIGIGTEVPADTVTSSNTKKLSVGILSAYQLFGDGSGLTNITASGSGIVIKDSGSLIGTAGTVNFASNLSVSAISGAAVTVTALGFGADAQENLYAGTHAGADSDADTCFNVAIGKSAGAYLNEGDSNVIIGCHAGKCLTSANSNVILGCGAAGAFQNCGAVTGNCNVIIGKGAGSNLTSGTDNILLGYAAGYSLSGANTGNHNIFMGEYVASLATVNGHCNIGLGKCALQNGGGGSENIALGVNAMANTTVSGKQNVVLGTCAGNRISSGSGNLFLGAYANTGTPLVTGNNNIAIGASVKVLDNTASNQLAIGIGSTAWIRGDMDGNNLLNVTFNKGTFAASSSALRANVTTTNVAFEVQRNGSTSGYHTPEADAYKIHTYGDNDLRLQINTGGGSSGNFLVDTLSTRVLTATGIGSVGIRTDNPLVDFDVVGIASFRNQVSIASTLFVTAREGYARDQLIVGNESVYNEQIKLWRQSNGSVIDFTHDDDPNAIRSADILALRSNYTTDTLNTFDGYGIDIDGDQIVPSHNFKPNLGTPGVNFGNIYATGIVTSSAAGIITYYGDGSKLQGVTGGGVVVQDEGTPLTTTATTLNFEGAGVVAGGSGAVKTITISGGGGGGSWSPDNDQNLFAGTRAGRCLDGTNGCFNIFLGCNSGQCTDAGADNVFLGRGAGYANTTGIDNIFLGSYSGKCNTVGQGNVLLGKEVGYCLNVGIHNFYALERAGSNAYSGDDNIAIGRCAGYEMTANDNVLLGRNAGRGQVFGSRNVIIGMDAGRCGETGDNNVMIGCNAGRCNQGTGNVFLGHNTGSAVTSASGNVVIGCNVSLASSVLDHQLAIGVGNTNWITGIENYNLGIGSDRPRAALDVAGTIATRLFFQNEVELRSSENFPAEGGPVNGGVFGPYTIGTGACLTIGPGSTFTIIGIPE